ncbi:2OG-Fe(II) oxygenase [Pseudoalteromonas sp. APC 3694]|uniref:2OG-Fe(II) oxygenase n=1 Tax=Pseudoalteromonas sp. APC 3694 TaxID=3035202 RepID=UPI0025B2B90D|nr:2OG-Fe(II) oxygenase [Pseudoalteromonas sp. APC 3694]MDN3490858.1 2OG-Fe(II) oxygenase [Pseudoalteromonas sp. APC 3694]
MSYTRKELANFIVKKLQLHMDKLTDSYSSMSKIQHFYIDDLLPEDLAAAIYNAFPEPKSMSLNKTLREYKYIAAQMDQYDPVLEEIIYAFQMPEVVALISKIVGKDDLFPDDKLYAGGISLMGEGHYLNPHLDNSHDKERELWRAFNLLYYVSPDWKLENGGNLELWPDGVKGNSITLESKFNRLIVMATHNNSWHSVSPIKVDRTRCCVSNYYFATNPVDAEDSFHVTSFRGRPEQKIVDILLRGDAKVRNLIRKLFTKGIKETSHYYKKED